MDPKEVFDLKSGKFLQRRNV